VKLRRREISKVVRYLSLPDQKKNKILPGPASPLSFGADRAHNLPAPDNVLRVLQILSKSVHFRRSHSRTR